MRILFALVAWGPDYVRDFLDVSLPTLLGRGNIASEQNWTESRFVVLTGADDVATFEASALFNRLRRLVPTEFVDIAAVGGYDKYDRVSRCQLEALRRSQAFDAVFLLYPDVIWSRGAITYTLDRLRAGSDAVMSAAPAVLPDPARKELFARPEDIEQTPEGALVSIEPRRVARLALDHHHPMWESFDWDGECFTENPACLRWNIGSKGWLIRCFHLHPVAFRVQPDNPRFFADFFSLDGEYVARLFSSADTLHFATNSDAFALVSLRDGTMPPLPVPGGRASVATVATWAEANAFLLYQAFVDVAFRWGGDDIDEESWRAAEARSTAIAAEVRRRLLTPDSVLAAEDPRAYAARRRRQRSAQRWRRLRVPLLEQQADQSRTQLLSALGDRVVAGSLWRVANRVRQTAFGQWLTRRRLIVAMWRRAAPALRPESELEASTSVSSLMKGIMRRRR